MTRRACQRLMTVLCLDVGTADGMGMAVMGSVRLALNQQQTGSGG